MHAQMLFDHGQKDQGSVEIEAGHAALGRAIATSGRHQGLDLHEKGPRPLQDGDDGRARPGEGAPGNEKRGRGWRPPPGPSRSSPRRPLPRWSSSGFSRSGGCGDPRPVPPSPPLSHPHLDRGRGHRGGGQEGHGLRPEEARLVPVAGEGTAPLRTRRHILRRNGFTGRKRKRKTFYPANLGVGEERPFALAQVDVKDVLDKGTPGTKLWDHPAKRRLPRYQWTLLEGRTRLFLRGAMSTTLLAKFAS